MPSQCTDAGSQIKCLWMARASIHRQAASPSRPNSTARTPGMPLSKETPVRGLTVVSDELSSRGKLIQREGAEMATFVMLGKYSAGAVKEVSSGRTKKAVEIVEKHGGKVESAYAVLGEYDVVLIVDLPGTADAMKVSVALSGLTGIGFTTAPAVPVEEFDELMAG